MFQDIFGNTRQKVALHVHTTVSDGKKTPGEALEIYRAAGFDAVALTDHWHWNPQGGCGNGLTVLSGCEYNIGKNDCAGFVRGEGVYHITAIGCDREPAVVPESSPREICERIREAGGIAVLAHPAWSLNDPSVVAGLNCFDATEIYNTVSGVRFSSRPDSSCFADLLACRGVCLPLIAADDAHYYGAFGAHDETVSFVCVRAEDNSSEAVMRGLRAGDYYASQGPQIFVRREEEKFLIDTSPVDHILVFSNLASVGGRNFHEAGITHAEYEIRTGEIFLRAEAVDADGKRAWSSFLRV